MWSSFAGSQGVPVAPDWATPASWMPPPLRLAPAASASESWAAPGVPEPALPPKAPEPSSLEAAWGAEPSELPAPEEEVKKETAWQETGPEPVQELGEVKEPEDDSWGPRWSKLEQEGLQELEFGMPLAYEQPKRDPNHVPKVIPPRIQTAAADDLRTLQPKEVERGMVVVYDTFKRAWVDNCYPDLDEFWLCDETDNKTIFSLNPAGEEDSVRAFTASELLFTGKWSALVEVSKDVIVTREILEKLMEMPEWEGQLEEQTGVSILIDKGAAKVIVGPGKPPDVKQAASIVKTRLEQIDRQIWSEVSETTGAKASKPDKAQKSKGTKKPKGLMGLLCDPKDEVKAEPVEDEDHTVMDVKEEVTPPRKRPRQAHDPELEEKNHKLEEQFRIGFERGFENALRLAQRRMGEISALTPAPRMPVTDAAGGEDGNAPMGDVTPLVSPDASKAKVPPAKTKRVVDWVREQEQFAHLPKLQPNWIRVKKSSGDGTYCVNTVTGETTLTEPLLSSGTTTPLGAFMVAQTPIASGAMTPAGTPALPAPGAPGTPMRNPSTPAPIPLPEGWTQITSKSTGKPYFWNVKLGISQFHFPSPNQTKPQETTNT